jgi:hypothetical protein
MKTTTPGIERHCRRKTRLVASRRYGTLRLGKLRAEGCNSRVRDALSDRHAPWKTVRKYEKTAGGLLHLPEGRGAVNQILAIVGD